MSKLRPAGDDYSIAFVLAVLLVAAFAYKALQFAEIYWSKALGSTDDDISLKLEEYGGRDAFFELAHNVLGNGRYEKCGDLCRILREYTNIRDTHIQQGITLVENFAPICSISLRIQMLTRRSLGDCKRLATTTGISPG